MALGWLISTIVAGLLGTTFALLIATMNKKVVKNHKGDIDFSKSDIYFHWTRWDYTIILAAAYTFLCITGFLFFYYVATTLIVRGFNFLYTKHSFFP
ncbi:hypothetical protein [Metabacillus endolithicus]|uniref:hypothetical protein n=1 Tax=Metabacillus endolithicus TaxID=1535204 RepID=UPI001FFA6CCB|nr:hypothetical protein [Metabacillus endolithicus]UPG63589.1 hypothetical protein MVE64_25680 [Metabacillus endolithicus]